MRIALALALLLLFWSCKQDKVPLNSANHQPQFSALQAAGCYHSPLTRKVTSERCFDYSFKDTLKVALCLPANCCPDSNRFDFAVGFAHDTINFSVRDTALELCDCICTYRVFTNISGLSGNAYLFNCFYEDSLYYSEEVRR